MNLMDGAGEFSWPNRDVYRGQYINGKRNGLGDMQVSRRENTSLPN